VVIRAPRLVRNLLTAGTQPRRLGLPLSPRVQAFSGPAGAESLAHYITDTSRDIPVVVFTPATLDLGLGDDSGATLEDAMAQAVRSVSPTPTTHTQPAPHRRPQLPEEPSINSPRMPDSPHDRNLTRSCNFVGPCRVPVFGHGL
jgi:hypothetical protein